MIEIRSSADDTAWTLTGLATTWDGPGYQVNDRQGEYVEVIRRGAFPGATSGTDIVELRVEHQHEGPPIAATGRSGTMRLSDTREGLLLTATLPKDDPDVQAAVSKAKRHLLDRMSIGFRNATSTWNNERTHRTVTTATLAEVSLVHRPANPGAVVATVRGDGATSDELEVRFGPAVTVIEGRRDFKDAQKAALPSFEELELELRALQYASSGRKADLRLSAQLASPNARLARAVAVSRRSELELELLLAKGRRR